MPNVSHDTGQWWGILLRYVVEDRPCTGWGDQDFTIPEHKYDEKPTDSQGNKVIL